MQKILRLFLIVWALFLSSALWSLEVPALTGPVVDQAKVLPSAMRTQLAQALANFKQQYGAQLQLLIIESLEGEPIEDYSIKVVDQWKVGASKEDNGVLFLVAMEDRQMRIEVGQGLEGDLTDLESGRIIQFVTPYFKQNKYPEGIAVALQAIAQQLGGDLHLDQVPMGAKRHRQGGTGIGFFLFLFFLMMIFGRGRRSSMGWFLLGMLGGRGSRGGGFGGGGDRWSGGGGGFSGGGASGRW